MTEFIIILCMLALEFAVRIGIFYYDTWSGLRTEGWRIRTSYANFKSFYDIFPDNYALWRLQGEGPCVRYMDKSLNIIFIYFNSYIDWLKVKYMFYRLKKEQERQRQLESMDMYLKSTRRDIKAYVENEKVIRDQTTNNFDGLDSETLYTAMKILNSPLITANEVRTVLDTTRKNYSEYSEE